MSETASASLIHPLIKFIWEWFTTNVKTEIIQAFGQQNTLWAATFPDRLKVVTKEEYSTITTGKDFIGEIEIGEERYTVYLATE